MVWRNENLGVVLDREFNGGAIGSLRKNRFQYQSFDIFIENEEVLLECMIFFL